jgi:mannose-6-phosphate isomerase-like protein (cupin superfamily)
MNIAPSFARMATGRVKWMGSQYAVTLRGDTATGRPGVFESIVPAGEGPPVHVHHNEDEILHLIEGQFEFFVDGERIPRRAGDTVLVPRGVPHTFRVLGERPGRLIAVMTPGGFEGFFLEVAERELRIPDHMDEVAETAGRYGLEFTGPPLSATG